MQPTLNLPIILFTKYITSILLCNQTYKMKGSLRLCSDSLYFDLCYISVGIYNLVLVLQHDIYFMRVLWFLILHPYWFQENVLQIQIIHILSNRISGPLQEYLTAR